MIARWRRALLAVCLATPAFALDVAYDVSARTDVRTRTPLPGDVSTTITADLELAPSAELKLGDTTSFLVRYAPILIWREPQTGGRLLPLHVGRLALAHRFSRANFLLSQDGAYGVADVGALRPADDGGPATPPGVNPVQTVGGIPFVRAATLSTLDARVTDQFFLLVLAGFSLSGSPEQPQTLPLQYGPLGAVSARLTVSRLDALTTGASVNSAWFVTGQEQLIAQLTETWDRQLLRTVQLSLGAGAALTREVVVAPLGIPGTYVEVLPVATAGLTWNDVLQGHALRASTSLRLAPFADRFTGFIYERLELRAQGEWLPARGWVAQLGGGGALAVPLGGAEQAGDRLIYGDASVSWAARTWLLLQASARVLWTEQPRLGFPGLVQAVGTVSVTVREQDSLAW